MKDPLSPEPQSQTRTMVSLVVLMLAAFAWTFFFSPQAPPPSAGPQGADAGTASAAATPPPAAPGTPGPDSPGPSAGAPAPPQDAPPVRTLERKHPEVAYGLSTEGAGLTSAVLLGKKMREQADVSFSQGIRMLFGGEPPEAPQMNLAQPVPGQPLPLAVSIEGAAPLPASTRYAVTEEGQGGALVMAGRGGPWELTKRLTWAGPGFEFAYTVTVRNTSGAPLGGELVVHHNRAVDPNFEKEPSFFGGVGNLSHAACHVGDDLHRLAPTDKPAEALRGPVHYFGIVQQYFLSTLYPLEGPREGRCQLVATPSGRTVAVAFPLQVPAGGSVTYSFGGFFGPKEPDLFAQLPAAEVRRAGLAPDPNAAAPVPTFKPTLEETVDLGIWAFIARILLAVMRFFHSIIPNWGIAIVLLTLTVKLVLLPFTLRSMVSMESMKKLQPRMEEIRKKFKDDRERQNMEMMKLYQEAKVNPLGGCLPLLIQMPVWFALFTALRNSFDLYREPFIAPVWGDLTNRDPTYILPLALGVTMVITQLLQPQMMDAAQARIMTWVLPIVFTLTLLQYPAGLSLYIFTNNVLSIAQQWGLKKWMEKRGGAPAPAPAAAAGGKRK